MKIFVFSAIVATAVLACGKTASAATSTHKENERAILQAIMYLEMKLPARAITLLEETVSTETGDQDGLVWMALARSHLAAHDLDRAGAAYRAASTRAPLDHAPAWALELQELFMRDVGEVLISGDESEVSLEFRLLVPVLDPKRRSMLKNLRGLEGSILTRTLGKSFFLPVGEYSLGGRALQVRAGKLNNLTFPKPSLVLKDPVPVKNSTTAVDLVGAVGEEEEEVGWLPPWAWATIAAGVIAAAVTGVAVAVDDSVKLNFERGPR